MVDNGLLKIELIDDSSNIDVSLEDNSENINVNLTDYNDKEIREEIEQLQETKADKTEIPTKVSQLQNDSQYITNAEEIDPTVPSHVKNITQQNITNWNNKAEISDIPDVSNFVTKDVNNLTYYTKTSDLSNVALSGSYNDLTNKPDLSNFATKTELGNETTARENADIGLQGQIDAITSSSDVKDIVGTYTELQNYDTSTLGNDDIIKVLQDSTHNEAMTYYRWVISGSSGSWQYIGQEGPYYTKSETETLLNNKQDEITSSNKLNSDLVSDTNQTNKFVTENEKTTWNNKANISDIPIDFYGRGTIIPDNSDLDNYTTIGKYYVNSGSSALSLTNCPTTTNFVLYVIKRTDYVSQIIIDLSGKIYTRSASSSGLPENWTTGVVDNDYVHTDNNFSNTDKTKLDSIDTGAEVNVQADWNEANTSSDAYIQNKPSIPKYYYGTCSTKNSTRLKVVECEGFVLEEGATISVLFTNAQTYNGAPQLNVNGTGAVTVQYKSGSSGIRYMWSAGEIIDFTYNGTYWVCHGRALATTTYYGVAKYSESIVSTSASLGLTPSAMNKAMLNIISGTPIYSSSATYEVGNKVRYSDNVWRCTTAISEAEAWDEDHWEVVDTLQDQIYNKQDITDNNLTTTNKTITSAINEVNSIAKGANQSVGYANYSAMVTALNSMDDDEFEMGQNIYIVTVNVPDLWVSSVESSSSTYTYVDDATIISALETNGYIQVGYYKLSMLETQKADLTNYVKNTDYATSTTGGVVRVYSSDGFAMNNGVLIGATKTNEQYEAGGNWMMICKGTLENVITGKNLETANHLVTQLSSNSTDLQYPSAKCVYDSQEEQNEKLDNLENEHPIKEVTGTNLSIDNTGHFKLDLGVKGNISQTITGINKFNFATATANSGVSKTSTGFTTTAMTTYAVPKIALGTGIPLTAGTDYYISYDVKTDSGDVKGLNYYGRLSNDAGLNTITSFGSLVGSFTMSNSYQRVIYKTTASSSFTANYFFFQASSSIANAQTISIKNIQISTRNVGYYEYNGLDESPIPSSQSVIKKVDGEYELTVADEDNVYSYDLSVDTSVYPLFSPADYYYKYNSGWYVHNEWGKVILDGSENWSWNSTGGYYSISQWCSNNNGKATSSDSTLSGIYSDYFTNSAKNDFTNITNGISIGSDGSLNIKHEDYSLTEATASFKTWLSNNNTTVIYELNAPTNTQISNATIISELETLSNATSYQGQTNITQTHNSAQADMIIDAKALMSLKYMQDEIEDKYEKPSGGIPKTDLTSTVQTSLDKADGSIQSSGGSAVQMVSLTSGTGTTALGVKSMSSASSYISFSSTGGWLGSYGVSSTKKPVFYNGVGYTLATTDDVPKVVTLSQADYDALVSGGTVDADTYYFIEES